MSFEFTWEFATIASVILVITMSVILLYAQGNGYETQKQYIGQGWVDVPIGPAYGSERFEWWRLGLGTVYFVIALGLSPKPVSEFSEFYTCGFLGGGLLCGVSALASIVFQVMAFRHFIYAWVNRFFLPRPDEPVEEEAGHERVSWTPTIVLVAVIAGGIYSCTEVVDRQYVIFVKEEVAEEMRKLRNDWGLVSGVDEDRVGAAIGWVAVDPDIYIDWNYERELGEQAQRSIPLRVVLLNNSFNSIALDSLDNNLWRVWVTGAGSERVLREWPHSALGNDKMQLYPAQRLDFLIDWNGRDENDALLGPGSYVVHLETAVVESEGQSIQASVRTHIDDVGPEVEIIRDPVVDYVEGAIQHKRLSDMMRRSMRESEELRNSLNQLIYGR